MRFDGLEPQCCEDIKGIVAPKLDLKSFGPFEKQAPWTNKNYYYAIDWKNFSQIIIIIIIIIILLLLLIKLTNLIVSAGIENFF